MAWGAPEPPPCSPRSGWGVPWAPSGARLRADPGCLRAVPGPVGHLSFSEILDTSLKVSWQEPLEKNGILTGEGAEGRARPPPDPTASLPAPRSAPWGGRRGADGSGCPPGYRISWEEYNRTNTRVTHYLPNVTLEYRVTGLTALTTYTIEVAAMTSKGQGQVSSSTISSGVPPGERSGTGTLRDVAGVWGEQPVPTALPRPRRAPRCPHQPGHLQHRSPLRHPPVSPGL